MFYQKGCSIAGRVICLDPGHGGKDRANRGFSGEYIEADGVLDIALRLEKCLGELGAFVVMTRKDDITLSLSERCAIAEKAGAEIFISIHSDACSSASVKGATAYYSLNPLWESKRLANTVISEYTSITGVPSRGSRFRWNSSQTDDYYGVLRGTSMPAVILECAFHTNQTEEAKLLIPEFRAIAAMGIKLGILRYFRESPKECY